MRLRFPIVLSAAFSIGLGFGCKTGASDAGDFAENFVHNYCYLIKKCSKLDWNDQEYENIQDCEDEVYRDLDYDADGFAADCDGYDKEMGRDCLQQLISEYNSCAPEHDCDDGDYDPDDNPCVIDNLCPDGYSGPFLNFGCI
jgi:hypothetical protein